MFVFVRHLLRGGRDGRARTAELRRLLARYEAQPGRLFAGRSARAAAERIVELKRALSRALSDVQACSGCARGCAPPSGFFVGGRCCGTSTLDVFTQPEVRALKLAGVAPPMAPAEDGDERAGCSFRGRTGCSLEPEARPARCLDYVCSELRVELEADGRLERISALRRELKDAFERFEACQH